MDYDKRLNNLFGGLEINIVRHDDSPTGYPCYIEAHLGKTPKDKGETALDLGNYIYRRTGLRFQSVPEYRGRGKTTTLRWFMSWDNVRPILGNIRAAVAPESKIRNVDHLPIEFRSLIIQNAARGVRIPESVA